MELAGKVVVITGASSGLGRAAAVEFSRQRCIVVLAARREDALEETARQCRAAGGRALIHVTDVTREAEVQALADFAFNQAGGLDVWVNNAGITCFAPLDGLAFEDHRRVLETNVYGAIHGARAAVPVFRRQRRGVLINVGSVLGKMGHPFVPSYVISKFALQGMTEALRAALANEPDIHVCSLLPYAMNTPHFASGANHLGRAAHPMPPLQPPEAVARCLVQLARHPHRQRFVPRAAVLGLALHFVFPRATERLLLDVLTRWHLGRTPLPETTGNLYEPQPDGASVQAGPPPQVSTRRLLSYAFRRFLVIQLELLRDSLRTLPNGVLQPWARRARLAPEIREALNEPVAARPPA